ncbi:hypothetical protein SAMN05892877_117127 [Rhizobium subbaraonis]|uniref:Uncharacterized protein n=1 Tax=Rhizobium subbaraonis TaxID=908946 RepID=A0A285UWL4_9HYPH|nr:hypothetical protein [Rhizobium subbaraonis]SOC45738.1 hypothetical protein SAMN05892877_117127 [Rhizobium subbaraonis]
MNIHSRKTYCCPNCGSSIGEASPVERILDADLTRQQRLIVTALSERVGEWVRVSHLENLIWAGNETKRPIDVSRQSISTQIFKIKEVIRPLGWFVGSDRRGNYRLIPLEKTP